MGIPMLKIRRSRDRLIFNMGILILVRQHLYTETPLWFKFWNADSVWQCHLGICREFHWGDKTTLRPSDLHSGYAIPILARCYRYTELGPWARFLSLDQSLLRVSSDYAQPITGQVTEVTCPAIGWTQPELTPSNGQKTGPGHTRGRQLVIQNHFPVPTHNLNQLWPSDTTDLGQHWLM